MNKPLKKDRPFTIGFRVFRKGKLQPNSKMLKGNPFYPNTVSFKEWERGFNVAYYRNLERLDGQSEARSGESFQKIGGRYGK
tara:strand:- start:86 stop:331 length:246 start_codon:yes stop_codon:yes gene_type:complete